MKKSILIFVLFITTHFIIAQEGRYKIEVNGFGRHSSNANCDTKFYIRLDFRDNTKKRIVNLPWYPEGRYFGINDSKTFEASKRIRGLFFYGQRSWRNWFGCKDPRSGAHYKYIWSYPYDRTLYRSAEKGYNTCGNGLWEDNIRVVIRPLLKIIDPGIEDFLPSEDNIQIRSHTGFHPREYNWEYYLDGSHNTWKGLSSKSGKANIFINSKEILGNVNQANHGRKIYIRQKWRGYSSNTVVYRTFLSAPHIENRIINSTTCYDSADGSVKIKFDRAFYNGEKLSFSLKNITTGEDFSKPNVESLSADNTYTINNLSPGNYRLRLLGSCPGYRGLNFNTYIGGNRHKASFTIKKPTPVEFSTSHTNVWCNGGNDGSITIKANGGKRYQKHEYLLYKEGENPGNDWKQFSDHRTTGWWSSSQSKSTHTISGLPAGVYKIKVRDANGCIAKEIVKDGSGNIVGLGNEIINTESITQPDAAVQVRFVYEKQPTAFGFSDGKIKAEIKGGVPINGKYNYTWTHENGTVWNSFTDEVDTDEKAWYLTLENAIAGKYFLTVTDANYSSAGNKVGCTVANAEYTLGEPEKLTLSVSETHFISCNNTNEFGDPSSDGELTATADGGVKFDPLLNGKYAYKYTWKKKDKNGVYRVIPGENGHILKNIDDGEYAVNIEDANGIIIGSYKDNVLQAPTDRTYHIKQPKLLQITATKKDVFCNKGTDGSIDITISGGTPLDSGGYNISWSNGETTEDISNLTKGTYTVDVTDKRGCQASKTIQIKEPANPIKIVYNFFEPTFAGATNGWIKATVTGGTPLASGAYTYVWKDALNNTLNTKTITQVSNGSYIITLQGIPAGTYKLTIQDKNYPLAIDKPNCTVIESEYILEEPKPLEAEIKLKKTISCNGSNTYGDPSSDGILEVFAKGGVKLQPNQNNGLSYYYTWKKETSPGSWKVLPSQTTNIASNLNAGNYAVNIKDANGIVLGEYKNNILFKEKDSLYLFKEPPLLELSFKKQDVYCYEGSDGWAEAFIKGGVKPYSIQWNGHGTNTKISKLPKGIYEVAVTDSRGCQVKGSIEIKQPKKPINVAFTAFATPTTGGASDGWIQAEVKGGTTLNDGSYTYYWQNDKGDILNTQTTATVVNGTYQIQLKNIPKGTYFLTIEDANYTIADTKKGCTSINQDFILYDPIEATVSIEKPISCHQNNKFNNPFSDGSLKVTVVGGLPFSAGAPYKYHWKKQNDKGVYETINQTTQVITGLSDGKYSVNVEDSRGVIIGTYQSLQLVAPKDVLFTFNEPELLTVSLKSTEISCDTGNNGTATVTISGGIPPYKVEWSNGQTNTTATNLIAGNYLVFVTDSRGCQVTGNITLAAPGGLAIKVTKNNPTCFGGNDGSISLKVSGGIKPYTYSWDTGEKSTTITNLKEGTYRFSLVDAKGCKTFREITLKNPEKIIIDLGKDKTLCKDQSYKIDGSIEDKGATYKWTSNNGFSSDKPIVEVTKPGVYTVTATSSLGCNASDSVTIYYSNKDIHADFLMSSQAYTNEEVVIFNTCNPKPEKTEWVLPKNAVLVKETDKSIVVKFKQAKTYEIGIISREGDCFEQLYKSIVIEDTSNLPNPGDAKNPFIESFVISPNPNKGDFKATISLAEASKISLRIFNMQGEFISRITDRDFAKDYKIPFNLSLASGVYFVVLETAKQTQVKRMIVN